MCKVVRLKREEGRKLMNKNVCVYERERERERVRRTDRQTDREKERQTDRLTSRQNNMQIGRESE